MSNDRTAFLYTQPTFIEGVGRIFDFGNALSKYNYSSSGAEADEKALRMDMESVANDLWQAIARYESERAHGRR